MASVENTTKLQYCAYCGRKLVWLEDKPQGFNRETGERLPDMSIYACPDYDSRYFMTHDYMEVTPNERNPTWSIG